MSAHPRLIYKLLRRAEWKAALAEGLYAGSADDARDGFIHFSTAEQLEGTARKHFRGVTDLVLLTVDAGQIAQALRWEPSRGGQLFPHLYAALPVPAILKAEDVASDAGGLPVLPPSLERVR
jgi:uncharacterized protein (DUF952 family)